MILSVKLINCGPFKNPVEFSMVPTSYGGKTENLCMDSRNEQILNTSVIYGKNSAGKTSFVKVLWALVQEVRNPTQINAKLSIYSPFKLDTETKDKPSELSIRFSLNNKTYRYHITFNAVEYLLEELYVNDDQGENQEIFTRKGLNRAQHTVKFTPRGQLGAQKVNLVNRNNLVLSQYKQYPGDEICEVANYVANFQIANGYNHMMLNKLWPEVRTWITNNRTQNGSHLAAFLHALDISVEGFGIPGRPDSSFDDVTFNHQLYNHGESLKDKYVSFDLTMESQGTKWLLLLGAKVIEALENGYVLVVDELDACFHFQATKFIMSLFKDPLINKKSAQLILTTHNIYLMDEKELRKDQVWFVQKDEKCISEMYSLSEFEEVDEDINFSEWYMANRFGGMPVIGSIRNLFVK